MTILPTGEVYACRRMESKVGSVAENTLLDLFYSSAMEEKREFKSFPNARNASSSVGAVGALR